MMHAITCFFNPQGYCRPRENYDRFRSALRGCRLHTIELSFTGEFTIPDAVHLQGGPQNVMWQKERLLNLLVETLPEDVTRVAWLDCDVLLGNPHWAERADEALDAVSAVQLFENAHFLDQHGRIIRTRPSWSTVIQGNTNTISAPGFAWAARRELFPLLDIAICGGGDKLMVEGWRGNYGQPAEKMNKAWCQAWIERSQRQRDIVQRRIGHVQGDIIHCWHGSLANRNYTDRWKYLTEHRFDPQTDIQLDDNGLWCWSSDKPQMHQHVAAYFAERREDG